MKVAFVLFLAIGIVFADDIDPKDDEGIKDFEKDFHELTNDPDLEAKEAAALEDNEEQIKDENKKFEEGKDSFSEKVGPLSDIPNDEFKNDVEEYKGLNLGKSRYGLGFVADRAVDEASEAFFDQFRMNRQSAPSSYSAVALGKISPVQNQMQCGSCAAFSAVATIETCMYNLVSKFADLSEQNLLDCGIGQSGLNGCNGADPRSYLQFASGTLKGELQHETVAPYRNTNPAPSNTLCSSVAAYHTGAKVTNQYYSYSMDEETLKGLVAQYGAVIATVYASDQSFQNYGSGVYDGCSSQSTNHAITVVGYGTENGKDYWLVKNSWGTNWGDKGFIKIQRGVKMCGIGGYAAVPMCTSSSGATSAPIITTTPKPSSTCDISKLYGPNITGRYKLTTTMNGVSYVADVTCTASICSAANGGVTNACTYICGNSSC